MTLKDISAPLQHAMVSVSLQETFTVQISFSSALVQICTTQTPLRDDQVSEQGKRPQHLVFITPSQIINRTALMLAKRVSAWNRFRASSMTPIPMTIKLARHSISASLWAQYLLSFTLRYMLGAMLFETPQSVTNAQRCFFGAAYTSLQTGRGSVCVRYPILSSIHDPVTQHPNTHATCIAQSGLAGQPANWVAGKTAGPGWRATRLLRQTQTHRISPPAPRSHSARQSCHLRKARWLSPSAPEFVAGKRAEAEIPPEPPRRLAGGAPGTRCS